MTRNFLGVLAGGGSDEESDPGNMDLLDNNDNVIEPVNDTPRPTEPVESLSKRADLSQVTAMVVDPGTAVDFARVLGKAYKKVYYCNPSWVDARPIVNEHVLGYGYDEIEICFSPFEHFDDVNLFVFPYVGFGGMQDHLASIGKAVWGSRSKGEDLELNRKFQHELFGKLKLPVGKYEVTGKFENTPIRTIGNILTVLSFVGLIIIYAKGRRIFI